jgi:hypothetical protein
VSSDENINVLAALEDILKCGGWCSMDNPAEHNPTGSQANGTYFYRFRDINECSSAGNFHFIQTVSPTSRTVMTHSRTS